MPVLHCACISAGALFADLSAAVAGTSLALAAAAQRALSPLPSITMAFARIEGGKQLLAWNKSDALDVVNEKVVAALMAGLRAVRGGYLCRVQEGELKYMVAFYDPQVRRFSVRLILLWYHGFQV